MQWGTCKTVFLGQTKSPGIREQAYPSVKSVAYLEFQLLAKRPDKNEALCFCPGVLNVHEFILNQGMGYLTKLAVEGSAP